jgi:predicted phosphodiesterase
MSRIIAISDIHGFKNVLAEILIKISVKYDFKTNKLVFLGDYVDRGNDDFGTIDFFKRFKIYHKEKSFSFTHGGIPEKYTLISEVPKDQLLWSRETWFKYN